MLDKYLLIVAVNHILLSKLSWSHYELKLSKRRNYKYNINIKRYNNRIICIFHLQFFNLTLIFLYHSHKWTIFQLNLMNSLREIAFCSPWSHIILIIVCSLNSKEGGEGIFEGICSGVFMAATDRPESLSKSISVDPKCFLQRALNSLSCSRSQRWRRC